VSSPPTTGSDNDSGCPLDEYSWVPPGLAPSQVFILNNFQSSLADVPALTYRGVNVTVLV